MRYQIYKCDKCGEKYSPADFPDIAFCHIKGGSIYKLVIYPEHNPNDLTPSGNRVKGDICFDCFKKLIMEA